MGGEIMNDKITEIALPSFDEYILKANEILKSIKMEVPC
jgi:hypothetical protein